MASMTLDHWRQKLGAGAVFVIVGTVSNVWVPGWSVWIGLIAAYVVWPRAQRLALPRVSSSLPSASAPIDHEPATVPMPVVVPSPMTAREMTEHGADGWLIDDHGRPMLREAGALIDLESFISRHVEPHLERAFVAGYQWRDGNTNPLAQGVSTQ